MYILWTHGVSGDFATTSNWTPAAVPGLADEAIIIGLPRAYTVTSSINETVDSLTIANATLFITGASGFTTTNGGFNGGIILVDNASALNVGTTDESTTLVNLGNIELGSAATGQLVVAGDVSLQGHGKVTLLDGSITTNGSPATLSTDNVISGAGSISGLNFNLVIEARGVIDANSVNGLSIEPDRSTVLNSGTLEATNPDGLGTTGGVLRIGQAFTGSLTINNTPLGVIEANGADTQVDLSAPGSLTIVGGTLETRGANAVINVFFDGTLLDGSQPGNPVNIDGNIHVASDSNLGLTGTINNTGVITSLYTISGEEGNIVIHGSATLEGGGQITLSDATPSGSILGFGDLTNVDNVISGSGSIDGILGSLGNGILINEANGILDANASTPLFLTANGTDTNAGLMEATQGGTLLIENVAIDNFLNHTNGTVEARHNSTVGLENATIAGGFVTALAGSIIEAEHGSNTITGAEVKNAGTIGAEGANLTIIGDVNNHKGNLDANNGTLVIDGAVKGGTTTLEGIGEIEFGGASSAHVTIAANADAILKLDDPSAFTGKISGLTTGDYIDLTNINFADNPTLSYSSRTHVLTVTDSVSQVTDTIKFAGVVGSFLARSDGSGGTFITDPSPPANMVAVSHGNDTFVFAPNLGENTIANFNAHNDAVDPPKSDLADFAAFLAQAHQDGAFPIAHDVTDIMHHAETAQHAHDFLV